MSGAETVKGSTSALLSLGVVGGSELAGAADLDGAVVGVVEDVLKDEGEGLNGQSVEHAGGGGGCRRQLC